MWLNCFPASGGKMTCGSCKALAKSLPVWQKAFPTLVLLANEGKMLGRGKAEDTVRKSFANLIEKGCFCGTVSAGEIHSVCFTMSNWTLWVLGRQDAFLTPRPWLWGYSLVPCVTTTSLARKAQFEAAAWLSATILPCHWVWYSSAEKACGQRRGC